MVKRFLSSPYCNYLLLRTPFHSNIDSLLEKQAQHPLQHGQGVVKCRAKLCQQIKELLLYGATARSGFWISVGTFHVALPASHGFVPRYTRPPLKNNETNISPLHHLGRRPTVSVSEVNGRHPSARTKVRSNRVRCGLAHLGYGALGTARWHLVRCPR